jgi:hypothetical protein
MRPGRIFIVALLLLPVSAFAQSSQKPIRIIGLFAPEHDPEKLQTFRIRSCDQTNAESENAIRLEAILL